ncbi:MAG: hypothetical protein LH470_04175 [Lysobacter sp.]|nr:hypothetical protein [Lysobacter sp.]
MSLDLVDDFFSGPIVVSWDKLRRFVEEDRVELQRATYNEWFQWLAERMHEREICTAPVPAYIEHKDWKPKA